MKLVLIDPIQKDWLKCRIYDHFNRFTENVVSLNRLMQCMSGVNDDEFYQLKSEFLHLFVNSPVVFNWFDGNLQSMWTKADELEYYELCNNIKFVIIELSYHIHSEVVELPEFINELTKIK